MAASARPYFVTFNGARRLIEASSPAAAVAHAAGVLVSELRPARAAEVSHWYRDQHPIDVAGDETRPLSPGIPVAGAEFAPVPVAPFSLVDAREWVGRQFVAVPTGMVDKARASTLEIFDAMAIRGTMELHDFQALRTLCPPLVGAIAAGQGVETIEAAMFDDESIDFQDIVTAIDVRARRESWAARGIESSKAVA